MPEITIDQLSETLRQVIREGLTTRDELADVGRCSVSSIDRYCNGETWPSAATAFHWCNQHPSYAVRVAIRSLFGTVDDLHESALCRDPQIVRDTSIALNGQAHAALDATNNACRDGRIDQHECSQLLVHGARLMQLGQRFMAAANGATEQRKAARNQQQYVK